MSKKQCSHCGKDRTLDKYNKDARTRDGYRYECKLCQAEIQLKSLKKRVTKLKEQYK